MPVRPGIRDYWRLYTHGMTKWHWLKLSGGLVLIVFVAMLYWSTRTAHGSLRTCGVEEAVLIQSGSRPRDTRWRTRSLVMQQIVETGSGARHLIANPMAGLEVGDRLDFSLLCNADGEVMYRAEIVRTE